MHGAAVGQRVKSTWLGYGVFKGLGVRGKIQSAGHISINVSNWYFKEGSTA